ncbi:succinate dehydrogenase [Chitinimonas prasina]|uniref:Succinate dehydrogenase n=1 Tax=Chitinimonas prasina TaxID=1434937 RepID=A0ABQ5YIV7_9NEIS|nr:aldehyde dehydrogenase family protein [Chitinimonas prasina]GLR14942.1 succinate dehydrogenase [Chitinimonas prasina]
MTTHHFVSCDPRTGEIFGERPHWSMGQLQDALALATAASRRWMHTDATQRSERLLALAEALERALPSLACSISREMGKGLLEAEDEVLRAAKWCRFMAQQAAVWLANEHNDTGQILRRPLGVVLAVTPWNYPVWQMLRPLAAALAAGNAVLIKPACNVAQTSALVETLCRDVLPAGLMQCLWVDELGTHAALASPTVAMLVCTGSENTGRQLGALAGHHLKPAVLELGGNNAFIVLDDADIDAAAGAAAESRCVNAGQACTAAKRFIVQQAVAAAFTSALVEAMASYRCGAALAPLARADLRHKLGLQVDASLANGARCLLGGQAASGRGYYYPATVLADTRPGMPAFDEELFGPVAAISVVESATVAVQLANAARQQLAASIWSADAPRAQYLAGQLKAGMVCFNRRPSSRFELPFSGSEASGYGSTLGRDGLLTFTRPVGWM